MPYTKAGLAMGHNEFGESTRFIDQYGLPTGRQSLSASSLEPQYLVKRTLDAGIANGGVGALNEGVDLVVKKAAPRKGQVCVLKRIGIKPGSGAVLKREIEILHILQHPNIVGFIDGYIPRNLHGQAHLVLEYCDRGNLRDLIKSYLKRNSYNPDRSPMYIPEAFLWHVFESLASALAYIHHGVMGDDLRNPSVPKHQEEWPLILHRDIKPENIFLQSLPLSDGPQLGNSRSRISQFLSNKGSQTSQDNYSYPRVVLADFGVCTQEYESDWCYTDACSGTVNWMSPELPDMTARGEVWAVGAVVMSLCLLFKDGPIKGPPEDVEEDVEDWIYQSRARKGVRDTYLGEQYSQELRHTVRKAVRYSKEHRPLSWQLLGEVRTAKAEAAFQFQQLPKWAFSKG